MGAVTARRPLFPPPTHRRAKMLHSHWCLHVIDCVAEGVKTWKLESENRGTIWQIYNLIICGRVSSAAMNLILHDNFTLVAIFFCLIHLHFFVMMHFAPDPNISFYIVYLNLPFLSAMAHLQLTPLGCRGAFSPGGQSTITTPITTASVINKYVSTPLANNHPDAKARNRSEQSFHWNLNK